MGTLGIDTTSGTSHRIKVLIIDSSLVACYKLGYSLEKDRFQVTPRSTLDEGIVEEVADVQPDVIVMDAAFVEPVNSPALESVLLSGIPILLLENGSKPDVRRVLEKLQSQEIKGYLPKNSPYARIAHAILAVFYGASVLTPGFCSPARIPQSVLA